MSFLRPSAPRRGRRKASRSGTGTSTVAAGTDLSGLAKEINPQVRGWINYYGAFYRSELCFLAWRINEHLVRWAMHKFKRFRGKYARATAWLQKVYQHTAWPVRPLAARRVHLPAGLWGPDDGRLSRPVLRAAGGEIPPADSPEPVGPGCRGCLPGTMLEEVVGVGFGHPGLLRLFGS